MSRAFVKEDDEGSGAELPERPVSAYRNLVTPEGLAAIEAELERLQAALASAGQDRAERAPLERDLRYWAARRANAEVVPAQPPGEEVRFGATVTVARADGREQRFRIVGEDEADPAQGTLSHASPLARAIMNREVGDVVRVGDGDVEIVAIA